VACVAAARDLAAAPGVVLGFLQATCKACHDDASRAAKFSVTSLGDDYSDARWVRILDRVAAGEI
jgi:hypothetical protein